MTLVRYGLLGPVRVLGHGEQPEVGSPQQRAVLALLLLSEGRQVTLDDIVFALWGTQAPRAATTTTRTCIARLRRLLSGHDKCATLSSAGGGYLLAVDPGTVDVTVFRQATAAARTARECGNLPEASRLLRGALSLWRGSALDGLCGPYFEGRRAWLEQLRSSAMEESWALDIDMGDYATAITDLTVATTAEPYRERLWELLMVALELDGRCAEALSAYRRVAGLLDDRLGLAPGLALRRLYERISA
jgi:DNA-binding SARP family transcriptional activator